MEPNEILKRNGIKITQGRVEILNILTNSENSLSAEKIYHIYRNNNININLSTVYRTLELFEEKGLTEKITLNDGVFSYKLKKKPIDIICNVIYAIKKLKFHAQCFKYRKWFKIQQALL